MQNSSPIVSARKCGWPYLPEAEAQRHSRWLERRSVLLKLDGISLSEVQRPRQGLRSATGASQRGGQPRAGAYVNEISATFAT